ncbi:MAG TPA: hypothetical protein VGR35_14545 [Tepidisphaeraceae bacterium]|nr:hypothetical protein [Tepidisphaeraceae bacterium]
MKMKHLSLLTAASIAVSGVGSVNLPAARGADEPATAQPAAQHDEAAAGQKARNDQTAAQQENAKSSEREPTLVGVVTIVPIVVSDPALPRGATFENTISDAGALRDTLAEITEAAFTNGGFNDVVERLVDMDRNRIGQADLEDEDLQTLNGRVDQLRQRWQEKYGMEFDIREAKAYAPLAFAQGHITDAQAFASQWPVSPTPAEGAQGAQTAGAAVVTDRIEDQGNIEKGREIAIARFPAASGMPELYASFIDEAFGWKIDAPNTLTARELRDNLLKHLTYLGENMNKLPANVNDAYRAATHHVLMAVYGVDVPQEKGAAN